MIHPILLPIAKGVDEPTIAILVTTVKYPILASVVLSHDSNL